jgi:LysR family transcriptional activator of glutamate synthase operon
VELRQLVYFDAVVRHGGFTRAAEQLRVAQPAVSAQVQRLERELGVALLARTTRRVDLTRAGEVFLARAQRVLAEVDEARAELQEFAGVAAITLRLGATILLGPLDLAGAVAQARRHLPGLRFTLRTGLIAGLVDALLADELDAIIGPIHAGLPRGLVAQPLVSERLVMVLPVGHRLADRPGKARLAAFADDSFVCLGANSGLQAMLVGAAQDAGFVPRIDFETDDPITVRSLVSAESGWPCWRSRLLMRRGCRSPWWSCVIRQPIRRSG